MIAIEASEYRDGSTMPKVEGAVIVEGLEAMTGADCMVSPINIPAKKLALIREHIENKAILIQLKRGMDLAASVGERLNSSLCKMREIAPRQSQRALLFIGTLACDHDGRAIIDGREVDTNVPGVNYWACQTALEAWNERGGVTVQLSRLGLLSDWLKRKETRLKKYLDNPIEYFYPEKPTIENDFQSDPLQLPVRINDWRVPMAYLIGPVKAQKMYEAVKGNGGFAFQHMSDPTDWPYLPKGVYKSDGEKFRERMNLKDGEIITVHNSVKDDY